MAKKIRVGAFKTVQTKTGNHTTYVRTAKSSWKKVQTVKAIKKR